MDMSLPSKFSKKFGYLFNEDTEPTWLRRLAVILAIGYLVLVIGLAWALTLINADKSYDPNRGWIGIQLTGWIQWTWLQILYAVMDVVAVIWTSLSVYYRKTETVLTVLLKTGGSVFGFITTFALLYTVNGLFATRCSPEQSGCLDVLYREGPLSLYFSTITLTTVGYGDFIPATSLGRFFAAIEALIGYVLLGLFLATLTKVANPKPMSASE
jgi:hypothetical protein